MLKNSFILIIFLASISFLNANEIIFEDNSSNIKNNKTKENLQDILNKIEKDKKENSYNKIVNQKPKINLPI